MSRPLLKTYSTYTVRQIKRFILDGWKDAEIADRMGLPVHVVWALKDLKGVKAAKSCQMPRELAEFAPRPLPPRAEPDAQGRSYSLFPPKRRSA